MTISTFSLAIVWLAPVFTSTLFFIQARKLRNELFKIRLDLAQARGTVEALQKQLAESYRENGSLKTHITKLRYDNDQLTQKRDQLIKAMDASGRDRKAMENLIARIPTGLVEEILILRAMVDNGFYNGVAFGNSSGAAFMRHVMAKLELTEHIQSQALQMGWKVVMPEAIVTPPQGKTIVLEDLLPKPEPKALPAANDPLASIDRMLEQAEKDDGIVSGAIDPEDIVEFREMTNEA